MCSCCANEEKTGDSQTEKSARKLCMTPYFWHWTSTLAPFAKTNRPYCQAKASQYWARDSHKIRSRINVSHLLRAIRGVYGNAEKAKNIHIQFLWQYLKRFKHKTDDSDTEEGGKNGKGHSANRNSWQIVNIHLGVNCSRHISIKKVYVCKGISCMYVSTFDIHMALNGTHKIKKRRKYCVEAKSENFWSACSRYKYATSGDSNMNDCSDVCCLLVPLLLLVWRLYSYCFSARVIQ